MKSIKIKKFQISNKEPLTLIAGPCVIENSKHTYKIAEKIADICDSLEINFIFKSSFDKANRSNIKSFFPSSNYYRSCTSSIMNIS